MSRLTVNEAGTSGYTDQITLTPSDFTTAAGNTTTQVLIPVKEGDVIEGAALNITEAFSVSSNVKVGIDANADSSGAATEAFIANVNANATSIKVDTGTDIDDRPTNGDERVKVIATGDGNITVISASALDVSTSGSMTLLLRIRRLSF
jgi:hypothetical protein